MKMRMVRLLQNDFFVLILRKDIVALPLLVSLFTEESEVGLSPRKLPRSGEAVVTDQTIETEAIIPF